MESQLCVISPAGFKLNGTYTRFMDMHSGGGCKLNAEYIYIEAVEDDAVELFEQIFGRDPRHVTCDCCGSDYLTCEVGDDHEVEEGSFVVNKNDISRL